MQTKCSHFFQNIRIPGTVCGYAPSAAGSPWDHSDSGPSLRSLWSFPSLSHNRREELGDLLPVPLQSLRCLLRHACAMM